MADFCASDEQQRKPGINAFCGCEDLAAEAKKIEIEDPEKTENVSSSETAILSF